MRPYIKYCTDSPNPNKEALRAEIARQMAESNVPVQVIPVGVGVLSAGVKPYSININGVAKSNSKRPQDEE